MASGWTSWRVFTAAAGLPALLAALGMFLSPESPKWLLSRGHVAEADTVLRNIMAANGSPDVRYNIQTMQTALHPSEPTPRRARPPSSLPSALLHFLDFLAHTRQLFQPPHRC
jgi:hypothetical protein